MYYYYNHKYMIKFLNNIENLLIEILSNTKSVIFFYLDNCQISRSLFDIINKNNYDLKNNIILINKNIFLKNNNSKFNNNSLNNYIFGLYPSLKNFLNLGTYIFSKNHVETIICPKYYLITNSLQILDNYTFYKNDNADNFKILYELFSLITNKFEINNSKNLKNIYKSETDKRKITIKDIKKIKEMVIII